YTWSKTLTDNIGYYGSSGVAGLVFYQGNYYNRRADYGRAFFDASHNMSFSATYDVPAVKVRWFGGRMQQHVNGLFAGWRISSIFNFHSGFPMTIVAADNSLQSPRGGGRPNIVSGQSLKGSLAAGLDARTTPVSGGYLNPAAFSATAPGTFGNAGIGI